MPIPYLAYFVAQRPESRVGLSLKAVASDEDFSEMSMVRSPRLRFGVDYHIYQRGIDNQDVFLEEDDYAQFVAPDDFD